MLLFYIVHTGYVFVYVNSSALRENQFIQIIIRFLTWTLPPIIYLYLSGENILEFLCVSGKIKKGIIWGGLIGMGIILLNLTAQVIIIGRININFDLETGVWVKAVILVGFSEEVLFRGFLLNILNRWTGYRKANMIQSFLFLLIHFPGWILLNQFNYPGIIQNIVYVFMLALLLGYVLRKTGSLWSCLLIHSLSNFASLFIRF